MNTGNIYNCKIESNNATWYAGGLYLENGSDIIIYNSLFCNNSAYMAGGAIYVKNSDQDIINCNFSGNDGGIDGGNTIFTDNAGNTNFYNSISWDPTAQSLIGGYTAGFPATNYVNAENSNINTTTGVPFPGSNNIRVDPNFSSGCDLTSSESALRDAGNDAFFLSTFYQFDYENKGRFLDASVPGVGTIDIGAYEYKCPTCRLAGPQEDETKKITEKDHSEMPGLRIYPNPAVNTLNVDFLGSKPFSGIISIYNVEGKKVYSSNINNLMNVNLNIRNLENGLYNIILVDQQGSPLKNFRFIKSE